MQIRHLLALLLFLATTAWAQPGPDQAIDVDSLSDQSPADRLFTHFEDPSGKVTLSSLLENDSVFPFEANQAGVLNKGFSQSAIWLKAKLTFNGDHSPKTTRYLELDYSLLDDVQFFLIHNGRVEQSWFTGDTRPFHSRPIDHARFLFPIELNAHDTKTVYLRIASTSSLRIPLTLWEPFQFYQSQRIHLLLDGIYFGILFLMMFYNLCLLLSVRDISYLHYVAFTASLALFQLSMSGYGFEFLWSELPKANDHLIPFAVSLICIFALTFTQRVLALRKQWPAMYNFFNVVILAMSLGTLASLILPYQAVIRPILMGAMIEATAMLYAAAREAAKGSITARWFLLAWSTMLVGALGLAAVAFAWIPTNLATTNAFMIGSAIQVALLSITLAERLNQINREKARMEKEAKLALEVVNRSLQDNNRIKDEFLATISHELRTPMNGVLGCLEYIHHEPISDKVQNYVSYADRSARHMMLLVDSLLTYTELQSGQLRLDNRPFQTRDLVNGSKDLFGDTCARKGIMLNFFIESAIPEQLISDFHRVSQILNNLLDNAVKFTHHGQVEVRIQGEKSSANDGEFQLVIQVSDSGIGIAPDKLDLIFERFRQVDGAFNRGYGGLGIGLAVIKALLDEMHGSIDVQSSANRGAIFTVHIPCRHVLADSAQTGEADITNLSRHPVLHLLVVEDNPVNQMVLKGLLKKQGFEVSTADNGAQAVEWVRQHPVDAILMDCQMPVMDGFQATREIRQLNLPVASVPIIAVTANAMTQDRERCLLAGMNDYVAKPVDARALSKKIIYWVNTSAREQRAG